MKTTIVALFAATVVVAAPTGLAQNVWSKTAGQQHKIFKKRPYVAGHNPWHAVHARGPEMDYPGSFGYAPSAPKDYTLENSRQAGGGGGGGM